MVMQAQDTFVAQLKDGSTKFVAKGEVLPDSHELVKRDQAGTGLLFRKLDLGEEEDVRAHARSHAQVTRGTTGEGASHGAADAVPPARGEAPKTAPKSRGSRA